MNRIRRQIETAARTVVVCVDVREVDRAGFVVCKRGRGEEGVWRERQRATEGSVG